MVVLESVERFFWAAKAAAGAYHALTPEQLLAQIHQESAGNARAVSPAGAQGLMQIMPSTGRGLGLADPWDPLENVLAGARFMSELLREFGSYPLALAAYNAGPHAVIAAGRKVPPFAETEAYVADVAALVPAYAGYLAGAQSLPALKVGDHGDAVRALQHLLGAGVTVDGVFGPQTERAVVAKKRASRLPADATVGAPLWSYLLYLEESAA